MPESHLQTRFTRDYGVRHPFAAAGMAFVGMTPALALAVSRAGGIGAFGAGPMPAPALTQAIHAIAGGLDGEPFNVNFITFFVEDAHIEACAAAGAPVVSFHWGHPKRAWIDRLHDAGVRVWEQVGSVEDAVAAVEDGVDAIVAQGIEAGGHNYGTLPTFALVPAVVDAVGADALVLASGGIADGRGAAAALALGADAVWVGTRLVASDEGYAHPDYKRRVIEASGTDTTLSSTFGPEMPHFNPMRILRNRVVAEYEASGKAPPADTSGEPVIGRTTIAGEEMTLRRFSPFVPIPETEGDLEEMPLLAGQGVGLVRDIRPAAEIVESMMQDAARRLAALASGAPAPASR